MILLKQLEVGGTDGQPSARPGGGGGGKGAHDENRHPPKFGSRIVPGTEGSNKKFLLSDINLFEKYHMVHINYEHAVNKSLTTMLWQALLCRPTIMIIVLSMLGTDRGITRDYVRLYIILGITLAKRFTLYM